MRFQRFRSAVLVLVALHLLAPATASAQWDCQKRGGCAGGREGLTNLEQNAVSLGVTAAVGGLTAGIRRGFEGESFWEGFRMGALGGAVGYLGKRVSGDRFAGAGLVGRELSAIGASIVLNASEGRGAFDRLILPVGLLRLELDRDRENFVDLSVDLAAAGATTYLLARGARMDWGESLLAGSPVLIEEDYTPTGGRHVAGAIELRRDYSDLMSEALAHEQVHVAQSDFASIIWSVPLERAILPRLGVPPAVANRLNLGIHHLLRLAVVASVEYENDPWEMEARLLSGSRGLPAISAE